MNEFVASNGRTIEVCDDRYVIRDQYNLNVLAKFDYFDGDDAQALRDFFLAEDDERLGRWRWPENPVFVVYAPADLTHYVRVLDESVAVTEVIHRENLDGRGSLMAQAARAYFDAHPEPKPWHDANAGEVWLLTIDREIDVPAVASSSEGGHIVFTAATGGAGGTEELPPSTRYITAGRRIWPERES